MFRKYAKGGIRAPEFEFSTPPPLSPVANLRPCLADDKPAVFHRWVDEDKGLLQINAFVRPQDREIMHRLFQDQGVVPSCGNVEKLRVTFALVEYPDGSVGKVTPELIQFLDRGGEQLG
jgi:hypothetical protein